MPFLSTVNFKIGHDLDFHVISSLQQITKNTSDFLKASDDGYTFTK